MLGIQQLTKPKELCSHGAYYILVVLSQNNNVTRNIPDNKTSQAL